MANPQRAEHLAEHLATLNEKSERHTWTWPLIAYAALVALYWVIWSLPGRPSIDVGVLVLQVLIDLALIAGLFARRRWVWWLALVRAAGATLTALYETVLSGAAPGWIGILVVSIATLAVLSLLWSPRLAQVV